MTKKPTTMVAFRAPVQKRSRESLARIYSAINALLQEKTFDQITMEELSKRADVTIGSIYQRFGSKDQVLWVMYGTYLDEAIEKSNAMIKATTGKPMETRLDAQISLIFDLFQNNKGVIRSLLVKYRQDPESVPERYRNQIDKAFENAVRYLTGDNREAYSEQAILYAVAVIAAMSRELLLFQEYQWSTPTGIKKSGFVSAVKAAVLGVLNQESS